MRKIEVAPDTFCASESYTVGVDERLVGYLFTVTEFFRKSVFFHNIQ